jgi:hypothetical protein
LDFWQEISRRESGKLGEIIEDIISRIYYSRSIKMYLLRKQTLRVFLLAIFYLAITSSGCEYRNAAASEIPIEGAVYHVHRPDGSHKTYLDVVIGRSFLGKLPDDIDSITVTGPNGDLSIDKDDFNYNPQWRVFWIVRPGYPEIGKYTFKIVSGNSFGSAVDTQSMVKTIPIPDVSSFKPIQVETDSCKTPVFSWPPVGEPNAHYYQLQIRDLNRRHVYRTDYVQDIFVCPSLDLITVFTSKFDNDSMGELWPQIIMVNDIFPAMLPPPVSQRAIKLDSKTAEKYVGDYKFQKLNLPLTIFKEKDLLFYKSPAKEKGELFPETETQFFGVSKEIGDFQAIFFKDKVGKMTHFTVPVGFGIWRFDKINK